MALLDPTAISDPDDYTPQDYRDKGLVIRRFKKDIRHQVSTNTTSAETIFTSAPQFDVVDLARGAEYGVA